MSYVRKRGDKWSFTIDAGRDPVTNKRKQKTVSGFKTKKEAEKAAAEMITDLERGNLSLQASRDTLGSFMLEYMETTLKTEIDATTYEGKMAIYENHIRPKLGHMKLQKITHMDLQRFVNGLIEEGLNPGTIRNIMRLVNQTFRNATVTGYVSKNVSLHVKKPNYKSKKHTIWSKSEWDQFLESAKEARLYPFYLIALNTGMRPGEILALSWDNVNLKQNIIRVERTIVYTKSKGIEIKYSPKNDSSIRNISIPETVTNYLRKYKFEQVPNSLNLVIPGVKSEIVYNSTLNKAMKSDIKRAGVPYITPHELRHTHATYLLTPKPYGLGIGVKAVSERLGHANTTVTLNTYAHALENMQDAIAEALDENMPKSVKKS